MLFNDWIRNRYFSSWWCHGVMLHLRHWDLSLTTPWEVIALTMMWKSINYISLSLSPSPPSEVLTGELTCWQISLESFHVIRRSLSNCSRNCQGGALRKFTNFLDPSQPSCNTAARKGFSCIILWCAQFGTWLDSGKTELSPHVSLSSHETHDSMERGTLATPGSSFIDELFERTFVFESRRPFTLWAMPRFIVLLCFLWL